MTNEEAIIEMQLLKKAYCNTHTDAQLKKNREVLDAYDSAIKALEQQPCEDCIKIPEGATNGDMIKAMFGEPAKISEKSGVLYRFMYRNGRPMFSTFYDFDWWNSPYRKEQE